MKLRSKLLIVSSFAGCCLAACPYSTAFASMAFAAGLPLKAIAATGVLRVTATTIGAPAPAVTAAVTPAPQPTTVTAAAPPRPAALRAPRRLGIPVVAIEVISRLTARRAPRRGELGAPRTALVVAIPVVAIEVISKPAALRAMRRGELGSPMTAFAVDARVVRARLAAPQIAPALANAPKAVNAAVAAAVAPAPTKGVGATASHAHGAVR